MTKKKILERILQSQNNVSFDDFTRVIVHFGFEEKRVAGSHHIFSKDGVPVLVNVQCVNGQAKPYQVRQFLRLLDEYGMLQKPGGEKE